MSISRSFPGSLGDDEAFALCVMVRAGAAIFGAGVLAQTGSSGIESWMAIGVGVAFGVLAPDRWGVAIAVTAAASLVAMAASGDGAPGAVHLVFPATVVGSWLQPRPEAAQPVSWIDAMLIGAASEAVLVSSMAVLLIPAALVAIPLMPIAPALGYVVGGVLLVAAGGWMHMAYGRAIHRMFPERFGGFALGQVLPITLLALTGGEPLVLLIVAIRSFCLWWGQLLAEAAEVAGEPLPRITVSPGSRRTGTFW